MKLLVSILTILLMTGSTSVAAEPKHSVVNQLAAQGSMSHAEAKAQVEAVFAALSSELDAGRSVTIKRFGKFYLQHREPRTVRNPRTGEKINVPARRYPRFSSSDVLKASLNGER